MLTEEAVRIVQRRWRKPVMFAQTVSDAHCDGCGKPMRFIEACCTVFDTSEPYTERRRFRVPGDYHQAC